MSIIALGQAMSCLLNLKPRRVLVDIVQTSYRQMAIHKTPQNTFLLYNVPNVWTIINDKYLSKLETELDDRINKVNIVRSYIKRIKNPSSYDDYTALVKETLKLLLELEQKTSDYSPLIDN